MATNNVQAPAVPPPQLQMPSTSQNAASPPSKRDLASWWKTFKKNTRREEDKGERAILLLELPVLLIAKLHAVAGRLRASQFVDGEPFHQAPTTMASL